MKRLGYTTKNTSSDPPKEKKEKKEERPKPSFDKKFYDKINIDSLSVKDIKDILRKLSLNLDDCFEKADLVNR